MLAPLLHGLGVPLKAHLLAARWDFEPYRGVRRASNLLARMRRGLDPAAGGRPKTWLQQALVLSTAIVSHSKVHLTEVNFQHIWSLRWQFQSSPRTQPGVPCRVYFLFA